MGPKTILTGTTGKLGSEVLKHLLQLVPASDIIVSAYNPDGHQDLKDKGVEVRAGDFNDPESLVPTFKGGEALLLMSLPSRDDEYRIQTQTQVIDVAKKAGVKHIYYTSLAFGEGSDARVMKAHYATEKYLEDADISYTIIRQGPYMSSYPLYLGLYETTSDTVAVPGDGKVAFATREDLGEATAKIIASGEYNGETVTLTGSKAYSLQEVTQLLSQVLKKDIAFHKVSEEEFLERNADKGDVAEWWLSTYPTLENGGLATVDPTLERLLGRKPRQLEELLRDTLPNAKAGDQELAQWVSH
jgi:NAD(P)H dehydrogenase (quinone)